MGLVSVEPNHANSSIRSLTRESNSILGRAWNPFLSHPSPQGYNSNSCPSAGAFLFDAVRCVRRMCFFKACMNFDVHLASSTRASILHCLHREYLAQESGDVRG